MLLQLWWTGFTDRGYPLDLEIEKASAAPVRLFTSLYLG